MAQELVTWDNRCLRTARCFLVEWERDGEGYVIGKLSCRKFSFHPAGDMSVLPPLGQRYYSMLLYMAMGYLSKSFSATRRTEHQQPRKRKLCFRFLAIKLRFYNAVFNGPFPEEGFSNPGRDVKLLHLLRKTIEYIDKGQFNGRSSCFGIYYAYLSQPQDCYPR